MLEVRPNIQTFEPAKALISAGKLFMELCLISDIRKNKMCGPCRVANSDLLSLSRSFHPGYQATREWAKGDALACRFTDPILSRCEDLVIMWIGSRIWFGNLSSFIDRAPKETDRVAHLMGEIIG